MRTIFLIEVADQRFRGTNADASAIVISGIGHALDRIGKQVVRCAVQYVMKGGKLVRRLHRRRGCQFCLSVSSRQSKNGEDQERAGEECLTHAAPRLPE